MSGEGQQGAEPQVIKPPPHIVTLADKTAEFVARVGPTFEARVFSKEKDNPDYGFLMPDNHYNAYYKMKVEEFKEVHGKPGGAAPLPPTKPVQRPQGHRAADKTAEKEATAKKKSEQPKLEKPAEQHYLLEVPPLTTALQLAIVKLCAQKVALNGESFRVALQNEHRDNREFEFLREGALLNRCFEQLVLMYRRVLSSNDDDDELLADMSSHASALSRVLKRVNWERAEREKAKIAEIRARMEENMDVGAAVDWNDFVIVQQIDFRESEDEIQQFPPPVAPDLIRVTAQLRPGGDPTKQQQQQQQPLQTPIPMQVDQRAGVAVQQQQQQQQQPLSGADAAAAAVAAPIIVQNYVPGGQAQQRSSASTMTQQCPVCGKHIPVAAFEQHVRFETMDKSHLAQLEDRSTGRRTAMAPDEEIATNINKLSKARTDIFDTGEQTPAQLAKRRRLEAADDQKVYWDGHSSSVDQTINVDAQIRRIHEQKGSTVRHDQPAIGPMPTQQHHHQGHHHQGGAPPAVYHQPYPQQQQQYQPLPPPHQQMHAPVPVPAHAAAAAASQYFQTGSTSAVPQPTPVVLPAPVGGIMPVDAAQHPYQQSRPAKRPASAAATLAPESEWRAKFPGDVQVSVKVPSQVNTHGWQLAGQTLTISVPVTITVKQLKAKIHDQINLPVGKQKLHTELAGWFKNGPTLAHYNVAPGAPLTLGVKTRGGK